MLHLHLFINFFLRKRVVSQGVFVIEDMFWAGLPSFVFIFTKFIVSFIVRLTGNLKPHEQKVI